MMINTKIQKFKQKSQAIPKISAFILSTVVLMVIIMLSISGMVLLKILTKNQELSYLKSQSEEVAGARDINQNFISQEYFTIITSQPIPSQFSIKNQDKDDFVYFDSSPTKKTELLAKVNYQGKILKTGIEVYASQNNGQYDQFELAKKILTELGEDYQLIEKSLVVGSGQTLSKIKTASPQKADYYVGVTTDAYYLIKTFEQTKDIQKYQQLNSFTKDVMLGIWLN